MAKMKKAVLLFFLLAFCGCKYHQILEVGITNWYEDKEAALSLSFDDGTPDQLHYAIPLLREMGFKATFYIIPSQVKNWTAWNELHQEGHEISSHSMTHKNLKQLNKSVLHYELAQSYDVITKNIPENNCLSVAYPFGAVNSDVIKESLKYYYAGRVARKSKNYINLYDDVDLFKLQSIGLWKGTDLIEMNKMIDQLINNKGWLIETVHGIINSNNKMENIETGWKPIEFDKLKQHYNYIQKLNDKIWIAPVRVVAAYINEKRNSSITLIKQGRGKYNLDVRYLGYNETCLVPLTIKIEVRKGSSIKSITQNQKNIPFKRKDNIYYIDFLPNKEGGRGQVLKLEFVLCKLT